MKSLSPHPYGRWQLMRLGLVALLLVSAAVLLGLVAGGARSADRPSGLIAFARADGIYVMRADGGHVRPLRRDWMTRQVSHLAWSPDGRKLAFVDGASGLWVMNADGSRPLRVTPFGWNPVSVTWSPNGRTIAFTFNDGIARTSDVWAVGADGKNLRRLAQTRYLNELDVAWRPSGGQLAVTSGGWITDLSLISTHGRYLRNLTPGVQLEGYEPDWSPDGRQIAFTRVETMPWTTFEQPNTPIAKRGIALIDRAGRSRVQLSRGASDRNPAWSPDGSKIVFVRGGNAIPINVLQRSGDIYTVNSDGTGLTLLTSNKIGEAFPAWQPIEH